MGLAESFDNIDGVKQSIQASMTYELFCKEVHDILMTSPSFLCLISEALNMYMKALEDNSLYQLTLPESERSNTIDLQQRIIKGIVLPFVRKEFNGLELYHHTVAPMPRFFEEYIVSEFLMHFKKWRAEWVNASLLKTFQWIVSRCKKIHDTGRQSAPKTVPNKRPNSSALNFSWYLDRTAPQDNDD